MNAGKRTAMAAGGVLATAAVLAGCGGGGGGNGDGYNANAAAPAMTMPGSSTNSAAPAPSVKPSVSTGNVAVPALELVAKQSKALGWVVTDGKGWILYRFDRDRAKPAPWSSCKGACAEKWPPVLVHGTPVLKGMSRSIVGKVRRPDGTWQLTLHGWPIYRFAGDTSPGQWKGQGVGGTWYTVKRTGARNTVHVTWPKGKGAGGASSSSGSTISDGYGNTSSY
jgi:predicted lipoprotein with Yx(FWY)xxD motif